MIELVVVMGIVMILTGLLLPVIASGRGAATDAGLAHTDTDNMARRPGAGLVTEQACHGSC